MSKEKTIEYRFFKAKSTEYEQSEPSLRRRSYATYEWTGDIVSVYTESALRLVTYTYDAWG